MIDIFDPVMQFILGQKCVIVMKFSHNSINYSDSVINYVLLLKLFTQKLRNGNLSIMVLVNVFVIDHSTTPILTLCDVCYLFLYEKCTSIFCVFE